MGANGVLWAWLVAAGVGAESPVLFGVGDALVQVPAAAPAGPAMAPSHLVSAERAVLRDALESAGFVALPPTCATPATATAMLGQAAAQLFERRDPAAGRRTTLGVWPRPQAPRGLPLWLLGQATDGADQSCVGTASVDPERTLHEALMAGIAHARPAVAVGAVGALPWVEVRHGPAEIDRLMEPMAAFACVDDGGQRANLTEALMPPAAPLAGQLAAAVTWRDNRGRPQVALTFDACSTFDWGPYNAAVIAALKAQAIPATLFIGGHWAETHVDEVRALAAEPQFELGNHSYSHPHMVALSAAQQRQELLWTQYIIWSTSGRLPRYFRPPYGEVDDALIAEVAQLGLYTINFDLPAGDADMHVSDARLTEWVLRRASSGSIVIMHMNHPGSKTAEVLPDIARTLRARGFVFATVSDLLDGETP